MAKKTKEKNPLCTWAIPKFPRKLKAVFAAYCRGNDITIRERVRIMVIRELEDARVDIPPLFRRERR